MNEKLTVGLVVPACGAPGTGIPVMRPHQNELIAALRALVKESESTEMLFADQRPPGFVPPALSAARELLSRVDR